MSMAEKPRTGTGETMHTPHDLVEYLRTQLEAAYKKEGQMDTSKTAFNNGSFFKQVAIPAMNDHELTRRSTRIVLKPPFSTMVLSQNDVFAEVYAIALRGEDGHEMGDITADLPEQFLVRQYEHGRYTPYELVTDEGVYPVEVAEFDPFLGFGAVDDEFDLESQIADAMRPVTRADELYGILSGYNIVATND